MSVEGHVSPSPATANRKVSIAAAKYVVVGRHKFTSRQEKLLEEAGFTVQTARIEQMQSPQEVVEKAKETGASAIVVQALPMHLLAQLLQHASRAGMSVYSFRIEAVATINSEEEARKIAEETGADIVLPDPRSGNYRVSKTVALQKVKRIVVEAEDVASMP